MFILFFKQKTADEMRISDWSSDVCSSDLARLEVALDLAFGDEHARRLAMLARLEDFANVGAADDVFEQFGTKHARHRRANFIDQIIDDEIGRASCRERVCK